MLHGENGKENLIYEERKQALLARPEYDRDFKSKFSGKLLDEFHEILTEEDILEFDLFDLEGKVNKEDMVLYLTFLPEHFEYERRLKAFVEKFFDFFKKPLPKAVETFAQTGHPGVFGEYYSAVSRLIAKYAAITNNAKGCIFRSGILKNLHVALTSKLNIEIIKLLEKLSFPNSTILASRMRNWDRFMNDMCLGNFGHVVGASEYGSAQRIKTFKNTYSKSFQALLTEYRGSSLEQLKEDAETKYQLICDNFRGNTFSEAKIDHGKDDSKSTIEIANMYKILEPGTKYRILAKFRVNLAPNVPNPAIKPNVQFEEMKTHGEVSKHLFFISHQGAFDFIIGPVDSELYVSDVLNLKESFTPIEYEILRNIVFDDLLEELAKAEPEPKPTPAQEVADLQSEAADELKEIVNQYQPYKPAEKPVQTEKPDNISATQDIIKQRNRKISLQGRKSEQSLLAICRILGATYRNGGRHNIIIHGNKIFPIPRTHGTPLKAGTLKGILDYFEITPEQFDEAYN